MHITPNHCVLSATFRGVAIHACLHDCCRHRCCRCCFHHCFLLCCCYYDHFLPYRSLSRSLSLRSLLTVALVFVICVLMCTVQMFCYRHRFNGLVYGRLHYYFRGFTGIHYLLLHIVASRRNNRFERCCSWTGNVC